MVVRAGLAIGRVTRTVRVSLGAEIGGKASIGEKKLNAAARLDLARLALRWRWIPARM